VPQCINCANDINYGARVCPYCHLSPYDPFATEPYPPPSISEGGIDPRTVGLLLGALMLPVFPVIGGVLLGGSILYGFWKRSRE